MTTLSGVDVKDWPAVSALLDDVLAVEPHARATWLAGLSGAAAAHRATLETLLTAESAIAADAFVRAVPPPTLDAQRVAAAATGLQPVAGMQVGPYVLRTQIGTGGMGTVWRAERSDGALRRDFALKLPHATWSSSFIERIERERDILVSLDHPHIARLYDAGGDSQGRPFLALEYVEGIAIDRYAEVHHLDVKARLRLVLQIADALAHAHARLVIHRDLKPSNIIVTADGEVRLLDFGIAKLLGEEAAPASELTRFFGLPLTPNYASPEQLRGGLIGTASDVYSLGIVTYELLTGTRPDRGAAEIKAPSRVAGVPEIARQLRGDLDAILNKALKDDVGERYATVVDFAADLERYLAREPVRARPDTFGYRAKRFVARNALQVGAGVAITITIVAGAGVAMWQAHVARLEFQRADAAGTFMMRFLEATQPESGGSSSMKFTDMLAFARREIKNAEMADMDHLRLLINIGLAFKRQKDLVEAESTLREAVSFAQAHFGDEDRDTAIAHVSHVGVQPHPDFVRDNAELDLAEPVLRKLRVKFLFECIETRRRLAARFGRDDDALAFAQREVPAAEQSKPAVDQLRVLAAYRNVATSLRIAGLEGGVVPARKAVAIAQELFRDPAHPVVVGAQAELAASVAADGAPSAAIALLDLEKAPADQSSDPSRRPQILEYRADAMLAAGDAPAAVRDYETLRDERRLQDGEHPSAILAALTTRLSAAQAEARRWKAALASAQEALGLYAGAGELDTGGARTARRLEASSLAELGRLDDSEHAFAALTTPPPGHLFVALEKQALARLRSLQGRHAEAELLASEALAAAGPRALKRLRASLLATLGAVGVAAHHDQKALEALDAARDIDTAMQPDGSPEMASIDALRAQALIASGRGDEAGAAARRAAASWTRHEPDGVDAARGQRSAVLVSGSAGAH